MRDAIQVKNHMLVINVFTGQHHCHLWQGTKGVNMMKIKQEENMFVNYVAKDSLHQIV